MADRKPHLLVNDAGNREDFQSRSPGRNPTVDLQNRYQHGTALAHQYSNVLDSHQARQVEALPPITNETGIYVEIIGFSGIELPLDRLDNRIFKLRSCRKHGEHEVATVFIPELQRNAFKKKIDEYLTQDTATGKPRNQLLIDSIAKIKLADLRSFWTDAPELFPEPTDQPIWWELWLKKRVTDLPVSDVAEQLAERLNVDLSNTSISFFDSFVILIKASVEQLESASDLISNLEELRCAKQTPNAFIEMSTKEQHEWANELAERIRVDENTNTAITVLDTGVNYYHPLLSKVTSPQLAQVWGPWPFYDDYQPTSPLAPYNDHGSRQAGLAALGELDQSLLATHEILLAYRIESGRILPPDGYRNNKPELYGAITVGTAAKLEINNPGFSRVYSLAVTSPASSISGQPSSWSAEIDQFAFGLEDDLQRLFVISSGNNQGLHATVDYWDQVHLADIEDPAQAWNALCVGAYTEKTVNDDPSFAGWAPFAKHGDVAPASRSSVNWGWKKQAPYKPDVVAEGGNRLLSPDGTQISDADVVSLLTTSGRTSGQLFETTKDTSAACALVSKQAALLMAEYPDYWPETIRGLVVHSAEWTSRMQERFEDLRKKQSDSNAAKVMLRCVGHGVPSLDRARYSANNALTLVVQDTLQPFRTGSKTFNDPKMNEMQLYNLPWPIEELRKLPPELDIKLRVTLSYFIEPNPGRRGYRQRYSYQSHGLRFNVIRPGQSLDNFRAAINKVVNDATEDYQGVEGDGNGWLFGSRMRTRGSLHSDTWTGAAADLADMHTLAIYPVGGWWKYRAGEERWKNSVRYSLIVSIDVPDSEVDIYSEVESVIEANVSVET